MAKNKLNIAKENCKGCGLCAKACNFQVLELSLDFNDSGSHYIAKSATKECKGCGRCYIVCPDSVIEVIND